MHRVAERVVSVGSAGLQRSSSWAVHLTRQGAVTADRLVARPRTRATATQVGSLFGGSSLIGLGVALFVHARLGLPPYDVLLSVIRDRLGLTLGQSAWAMAAVLFSIAAALGQRPRIGGLIYVLFTGVCVDLALGLINDPDPLGVRIAFVVFGMVSLISGISLVIHSGMTGGAFELLMRAGADRGFDPIRVRSSMEIGIFIAGVVLGGDAGVATVAFALLVGPLMRVVRQAMEDHRMGRAHRLAAS